MPRTIKQAVASGLEIGYADIGSAAVLQSAMANLNWGTVSVLAPDNPGHLVGGAGYDLGTAEAAVSGLTTDDFIIASIHTTGTSLQFVVQSAVCFYDGRMSVYLANFTGTASANTPVTVNYVYISS